MKGFGDKGIKEYLCLAEIGENGKKLAKMRKKKGKRKKMEGKDRKTENRKRKKT